MDWPCTESYVQATADAFGLRCYFQWRHGGFEREMLKNNEQPQPVSFQEVDGSIVTKQPTAQAKCATRMMFPQRSADLSVRWCSAQLKIDVCSKAINNSRRFKQGRFLMVTGERREESSARSHYAEIEKHKSHTVERKNGKTVRVVHQWRAVIDWSEQQVWDIIKRHKINPHPAYHLGFGRVSCMGCIFGNRDQWATVKELAPSNFYRIASYENQFGKTIHRNESVIEQANKGQSFLKDGDDEMRKLSVSREFPASAIFVEDWQMPRGAFKRCGGPT